MEDKEENGSGDWILGVIMMLAFISTAVLFVMGKGNEIREENREKEIKEKVEKERQLKFEKDQEELDKKIEIEVNEKRVASARELVRKYNNGEKIECENNAAQTKENDVSKKNGYLLKTEKVNGEITSVRFEGKIVYFERYQCE